MILENNEPRDFLPGPQCCRLGSWLIRWKDQRFLETEEPWWAICVTAPNDDDPAQHAEGIFWWAAWQPITHCPFCGQPVPEPLETSKKQKGQKDNGTLETRTL